MTVGELFEEAKRYNHYSLKLLIEFAVYEKGVLKMTDSAEALHKFFNPKHRDYVNKHLGEYDEKPELRTGGG